MSRDLIFKPLEHWEGEGEGEGGKAKTKTKKNSHLATDFHSKVLSQKRKFWFSEAISLRTFNGFWIALCQTLS